MCDVIKVFPLALIVLVGTSKYHLVASVMYFKEIHYSSLLYMAFNWNNAGIMSNTCDSAPTGKLQLYKLSDVSCQTIIM